MLTSYKLFKLLSRMIALAEQLFAEEMLQRIEDDNDYLNSVVFPTKQLFMYPGKSIILNFNKQTSLCKKLYDFIYFSYSAITF